MAELRWIKTSLLLILVLQFTAAATGQLLLSVTVRDGDEATLLCNSVMYGSKNCDSTTWLFLNLRRTLPAVGLVKDGQIVEEAKAKSDRLSVSEKCSLIIKNVTGEDVGAYGCRQFRSGQQQGPEAHVYLSVVTMTEHEDGDEVTLECSVSTFGLCEHRVKWLLQGRDVDENNTDFKTSQAYCSASLTFLTSHLMYTSRFNSFKCKVTEDDKVHQLSFRYSPSGEKTGWWRFISVSVGLAALIIIVVAVNMWARIKEKKTQMDQIAVCYDGEDDTVTYENIRPPDGV